MQGDSLTFSDSQPGNCLLRAYFLPHCAFTHHFCLNTAVHRQTHTSESTHVLFPAGLNGNTFFFSPVNRHTFFRRRVVAGHVLTKEMYINSATTAPVAKARKEWTGQKHTNETIIGRETKNPPKCKKIRSAQTYAEIKKKILFVILKMSKIIFIIPVLHFKPSPMARRSSVVRLIPTRQASVFYLRLYSAIQGQSSNNYSLPAWYANKTGFHLYTRVL